MIDKGAMDSGTPSDGSERASPTPAGSEKRYLSTACCRIDKVINDLFLPMLTNPVPECTVFFEQPDATVPHFFERLRDDRPDVLVNREFFLEYCDSIYGRYHSTEPADADAPAKRRRPCMPGV